MNKEYIKLDNNNYFISDEKGKVEKVYICSEADIIDDIFSKENKIEELKKIEDDYMNKISLMPLSIGEKNNSIKLNRLYSFGMICGFSLSVAVSFNYLFFIPMSVILAGSSCYFIKEYFRSKKDLSILNIKLYSLKENKKDVSQKISDLNKELNNIKKLVSYKRFPAKKEQVDSFKNIKNEEKGNVKTLKKVK